MKKKEGLNVVLVICIFAFGISLLFLTAGAVAQAYANSTNSNLTIFDDTDSSMGTLIKLSGQRVNFFANYTNFTGVAINSTQLSGICSIAYNTSTTYSTSVNMTYNGTSLLWQANNTFTRKGIHSFQVACNSTQGNITLNDTFLVTNTAPTINSTAGNNFVDIDGNPETNDYWQCTEDTLCVYNFSANVTDPDTNDVLVYNSTTSSNTTLTNFTLNSSSGILNINITNDASTGSKQVELNVRDSDAGFTQRILRVNVTAVNDIPYLANLSSREMNITFTFTQMLQAIDEENSTPFNLTINFTSCAVAEWSTRGNNCTLFTPDQWIFNNLTGVLNLTFTPSRNDVGNYTINFTLKDAQNGTNSTLVNFTVTNINTHPYYRYVCDNERNATENTPFLCIVNASDVDETNNLTLRSMVNNSQTWFTFNGSNTNILAQRVNASTLQGFNATFLVNFTPSDITVGNWTVNLTLNDTGLPGRQNSTVFYFYVANVPDGVHLTNRSPVNAFTSNNYTIFLDAFDDDLLVQDKNVVNEVLTFGSNDSRVLIQSVNTTANRTTTRIVFNGTNFTSAVHFVNLTVSDASNLHSNSTVLILNFSTNNAPVFNSTYNYAMQEGNLFTLNLAANVSDTEADTLTYSFSNDSVFPTFSIGSSDGLINFTAVDGDVGNHTVLINISDGIAVTSANFTFVVYNLNETPTILRPFTAGDNITVSDVSNLTATEDSRANFIVLVEDEDFKIPSGQKSYYNESLTVNLTIQGPNMNIFNLTSAGLINTNRTQYSAAFTPNKSDVGNYNITLNISDVSGRSDALQFNLTINAVNHNPNFSAIANQTSRVNVTFTIDFNATDIEDGADNGNLTYNITFLQGINFITTNRTMFNITTGLLNITFNDTQPGVYRINVTVNDTTNLRSSRDFYLFVYGVPSLLSPAANTQFNLTENNATNITVSVNHSVQDNLTFHFTYQGSLRYNSTGYANGSSVSWEFTPTFSDETVGINNISLFAFNPTYPQLNVTQNWSINITHSNAPVVFNGSIPNQQKNFGQVVSINMSHYFMDVDSNDSLYNQTLNFTVYSNMSSNSTITVSITNGSLMNGSSLITFTATANAFETFNITANDSVYSNISNAFTIEFTTPSTTQTPAAADSGGGGGGGGSTQVKPISLNLIVPGPLTARKQDRLIVPISLINDGQVNLNGVVLRNVVAKNGILREDLLASFDRSFFPSLPVGSRENLTLIVDVDTRDPGLYEITLNGTSTDPVYSDTAKLYINVEEGDTVAERISFTQEFIAQNPQCVEIKELVDEARELYIQGDTAAAQDKAEEALQACENFISQSARVQQREKVFDNVTNIVGIATVAALLFGVGYYWFRRLSLQRSFEANIDGKV